jgi:DNA-binding response OmpR family regulator
MGNRRALLVGSASRLKSLAGLLAGEEIQLTRTGKQSLGQLRRLTAERHIDLLFVDLDPQLTSGVHFVESLKQRGDVPLVLLGDETQFERHFRGLTELLAARDVEWVRTPVGEMELGVRINKVAPRETKDLLSWTVPELRSDTSGRLDAGKIAWYFDWTLTKLSGSLSRSVQSVHKTPDAQALQPRLEQLERAVLLTRRLMSPGRTEFLKWLNTPSPDLDGEKPGELLLAKPSVVVEWLEDAVAGQPA